MGLTVNTNLASNNALTNLNSTTRSLGASFERISSGLRITKAGDDAAGLGVAENLSAAARGLRQAMRNANDGTSLIQVAEGATDEVANIVKRMRELAVQSSSETLEDTERAYIQTEFTELADEVDRIAAVTEFSGVMLTDGSDADLDVQVGLNDSLNDRITITLGDLTTATLGVDTGTIDLSTAAGAQGALAGIDAALDTINGYRAGYGATQNRLESAMRNLETQAENFTAAESRIRDADFAYETAQMSKNQIMQQAGVSVLAQANQLSQSALKLIG